jgi:hypothetical protein
MFAKRKPNFCTVIGQRKNSPRKSWTVPTLLLVASREQIRSVENVILVIVILRSHVNECFHDFMFVIEPKPPPPPRPASVNLVLQHGAKPCQVSIALFVYYSYYSSTIRGLFVDYSRTIRTIRLLFAVYSYYSSTIRTIRFTILVLSITNTI